MQANSVADFLCKMGVKLLSDQVNILQNPSSQVSQFIEADLNDAPITKLVSRSTCNMLGSFGISSAQDTLNFFMFVPF